VSLRVVRRTPGGTAALAGELHPVLARLYAARGVGNAQQASTALEQLLPVSSLDSIDAAVDLLLRHRGSDRSVLVIGDFDADGATSTALLVRALRGWGYRQVDFLVPNRFEFGYGLTPEIVALASERKPSLIVTVDNGVSSHAGVAAARALGIDVLVTDHHLPAAELPDANVILNPNLQQSTFGSRALAGVGVAFYLAAALHRRLRVAGESPGDPVPADLLDLVALGTVADLVPLDANNRVLVSQGLRRIRAGRCVPGITALLQLAGRSQSRLIAADLGFAVGPRLNAAGRLDDMSVGIRCLLAESPAEASVHATRLDQLNVERRSIEARMQETAVAAVRHLDSRIGEGQRHGVCLFDASWHQGVVGLVAGRIKERLRRPVIAFADGGEGVLRGSARSVPGIHVRDVLDHVATQHPGLIHKFGGHAMAAGLSIERDQLDVFARAFDAEVARWNAAGFGISDCVETDGELTVDEIALTTAELLREAGPWGQGFPEPSFDGAFAISRTRIVGERHLKMWVEHQASGRRFDAIAFNFFDSGAAPRNPPESARLVYRLDVNEYSGERRLQLLIDHVLPEAAPLC